ncbi:MAG: pyridoxamine 5'-phosphate oxidase [Trueperaceae bacterium]
MSLDEMRVAYRRGTLLEELLGTDPFAALTAWLREAADAGAREPNAMALATVDDQGRPSLRMVLCKGVDDHGIVFYTNLGSRKAIDMERTSRAAATFWWEVGERQVRIEGRVERVSDAEADAYFARRPRGSRLGAWASPQSRPVAGREELERRLEEVRRRFGEDDPVPRPDFWGGYRIVPDRIEFWQGREDRLHDRVVFERAEEGASGAAWRQVRLAP